MKISIDINHPANVHYFKNFIWEMEKKDHEILITASNKEISFKLLDLLGFSYIKLGSYGHNFISKLLMILILDIKMYLAVRKFNPDIFIGFASARSSHIGKLLRKPSLIFTDTEHATLQNLLFRPFAKKIITPHCFQANWGKKQVKFNSLMELMYLHPSYFSPDKNILRNAGLEEGERFIFIRFVAWDASHDLGMREASAKLKIRLAKEIMKIGKVVISSEKELPEELLPYEIITSPESIHHLLYYSSLYIGEGATMASEAAVLGTNAVYINSLFAGTLKEVENTGLLHHFENLSEYNIGQIINKVSELLSQDKLSNNGKLARNKFISKFINPTEWLMNYVEKKKYKAN